MSAEIDIRRGFRRIGSALFWLMAAQTLILWSAERIGLVRLGWWLAPIALVLLTIGLVASIATRIGGLALHAAAKSSFATEGAKQVSDSVASASWPVRFALSFLPGANLLTLADALAAAKAGTLAEGARGQFNRLGAVVGGGLSIIGLAGAAYRWANGDGATLEGWITLAAIGVVTVLLFRAAAGWIAAGFGRENPAPTEGRR
jgi:hypothetical protein